jgi:CTP synthase
MPTIYQVPLLLYNQKLVPLLTSKLNLDALKISPTLITEGAELWKTWKSVVGHVYDETVDIVLVGKYVETPDAYLSVVKALEHSSMHLKRKLNLKWVDSEHLEPQTQTSSPVKFHQAWHDVCKASGIIVPGGFGTRGTEGMMQASRWARENRIPYLGVRDSNSDTDTAFLCRKDTNYNKIHSNLVL